MLGNDADALDATQDALVAAIRALGRFDGRSSFGTWLFRIATNTCIDEMRRRRRRPVTGIGADVAEAAADVSSGPPGLFAVPPRPASVRPGARTVEGATRHDPADIAAARLDIDAALGTLPVEFRTAVVLRDVCDLPYDEIARILGVPVGTVRSRIARARSALATAWETRSGSTSVGTSRDVVGNRSGAPDVTTDDRGPTPVTDTPSAGGPHEEERTR